MKNKVITAAYPFIPVEMNLFHMASTYLPADFYNRLAKFFGDHAIFVLGVDVHGKHARRKASKDSISLAELSDKYVNQYLHQFLQMGIESDLFVRTDDLRVQELERMGLENMAQKGFIQKKNSPDFICLHCNERLSKSEIYLPGLGNTKTTLKGTNLENLSSPEGLICGLCRSSDVKLEYTEHHIMKLERDEVMKELFRLQPSKTVSKSLSGVFNSEFLEWDFTRTGYYGFPSPFDNSKQLYLWCDSLFSKLIPFMKDSKFSKRQLEETEFVSFFGRNILPYYSLIFPTIIRQGFDIANPKITFSARGFCSSKEMDTLINIDQLLGEFSQESLRFYCGYTVPDDMLDFKLNRRGMDLVERDILKRTFNRFLSESTDYVSSVHQEEVHIRQESPEVGKLLEKLKKHYDSVSPRRILLELEQAIRGPLGKINPLKKEPPEIRRISEMRDITCNILSCYVPRLVNSYSLPC